MADSSQSQEQVRAPALVDRALDGKVAVLTLNQPRKRNVLTRGMLTALRDALASMDHDPSVGCVVLRANGPVFSAGHDLNEILHADQQEREELFELCTSVMQAIRNLSKPVIAEVHALATAAGCQLVATCDLVVASEEASFATPGVKIGLFCTTPGVALSRAVGSKPAMEMLLTGQPISAQEALRIGLVNRVVPAARLHDETMALAAQISTASSAVLAIGKRAFYEQLPLACDAAYATAEKVMVQNADLPDATEGMSAFLEKRPPKWRG